MLTECLLFEMWPVISYLFMVYRSFKYCLDLYFIRYWAVTAILTVKLTIAACVLSTHTYVFQGPTDEATIRMQ